MPDDNNQGNIASRVAQKATEKGREVLSNVDLKKSTLESYGRRSRNQFRRITSDLNFTNILTKFPVVTVVVCLLVTGFFSWESGLVDCRDGFCPIEGKSSMNVNGDLEVYLPGDSEVTALIAEVEKNWTTNVMVIYVESYAIEDEPLSGRNITSVPVLEEIERLENLLNPEQNDGGADNVIYVLSISTVIKEVNSSAGRVVKSFFSGVSQAIGNEELSEQVNQTIDENQDALGNYAIPDEQDRVDRILQEMPPNALDKLVRDVGIWQKDQQTDIKSDFGWNRGVIIIGISDELRDENGNNITVSQFIEDTQDQINQLAEDNGWESKGLVMTLTGPVPITNAVTEESFNLFWSVFPRGVAFVAFGLFIFHCDLLQTGRIRFVQGIKVLVITGLPTLCSVFITMGIIGWTNYEVTMTVIIVGPIILALGVSYGLHITNRYAESNGTPQEKMAEALESTGRAVLLSAITTIIGFISLTFVEMKPIQTVGWSLAGGILVVYIMTMIMVPNLTMMLDLKKPSHPPPKAFVAVVSVPINWTKLTLAVFLTLIIISAGYSRPNVEENVDLLEMAPQDIGAVKKMGTYSNEFEAGQPGFLLIDGDLSASADLFSTDFDQNDPYDNLKGIEELEGKCNLVNQTTAVSIVFLMKAIAVGETLDGDPILDLLPDDTPPQIRDVAELIFDREVSGNGSFWWSLAVLDQQQGGTESQNFLIYVFYNSLTKEMRELFISDDYKRSLIYIDMPFLDVKSTEAAVSQIDNYASQDTSGGITSTRLVGVASVTIEVNNLIVSTQWTSLGVALLFTILTLGLVFRDARYAILTTMPVAFTVFMQWLVMDQENVTLSLVTVMIGSILVGVGVDFSIHIANRVKELGGSLDAIRIACASTGMSLTEAVTVTVLGLCCAFYIPIPAIIPFVKVIIILLILAAISALILLPAIYTLLVKANITLTGASNTMAKAAGLRRTLTKEEGNIMDSTLVMSSEDAW
ncbi:MAG: MMPL family transporter [Candidatus Thermoplasmatota archaeon]|nr:MMPL family transporter [Candidatus Thermoplasmatota archaeon]